MKLKGWLVADYIDAQGWHHPRTLFEYLICDIPEVPGARQFVVSEPVGDISVQ